MPLNLFTVSVIAKTLGPELYGEYRYLIYFFTLFSSFIGFGGNFFTTGLANNHFDKTLISFYQNYILLSWVGAALLIFVISFSKLSDIFFPGDIEVIYIWIAFFLSFLTFVSQYMESMTDSCGLTKSASVFNFIAKLIGVAVLCFLIYTLKLTNLLSVFLFGIAVVVFTTAGFGRVLRKNGIPFLALKISLQDFKTKFSSFFSYSHPLLVLSIFTFAVGFLTRWVLQFFGGSVQQGYFSFSDSFSAFIIIFSNSITPLLQREFAISFNNEDIEKIKNLFQKSLFIFTALTSYMSIFIILNAEIFTIFIGGRSFEGAILPTQIMLFYPIPFIANNILYATIYATGKTPLLRNVQMSIGILNLVITYFLVAPAHYLGLNLGAVGFALSLVLVTYLNHLILLQCCAALLNLTWSRITINYLKIIVTFALVGFACKFLFGLFLHNLLSYLLMSGLLYTLVAGTIFFRAPTLAGFSRTELYSLFTTIIKYLSANKIFSK